jgi:hypothetical protein
MCHDINTGGAKIPGRRSAVAAVPGIKSLLSIGFRREPAHLNYRPKLGETAQLGKAFRQKQPGGNGIDLDINTLSLTHPTPSTLERTNLPGVIPCRARHR